MPTNVQVRLQISQDHLNWLNHMESKGVDKTSVINIALDILRPRFENLDTTEELISETVRKKTFEENEARIKQICDF